MLPVLSKALCSGFDLHLNNIQKTILPYIRVMKPVDTILSDSTSFFQKSKFNLKVTEINKKNYKVYWTLTFLP